MLLTIRNIFLENT